MLQYYFCVMLLQGHSQLLYPYKSFIIKWSKYQTRLSLTLKCVGRSSNLSQESVDILCFIMSQFGHREKCTIYSLRRQIKTINEFKFIFLLRRVWETFMKFLRTDRKLHDVYLVHSRVCKRMYESCDVWKSLNSFDLRLLNRCHWQW